MCHISTVASKMARGKQQELSAQPWTTSPSLVQLCVRQHQLGNGGVSYDKLSVRVDYSIVGKSLVTPDMLHNHHWMSMLLQQWSCSDLGWQWMPTPSAPTTCLRESLSKMPFAPCKVIPNHCQAPQHTQVGGKKDEEASRRRMRRETCSCTWSSWDTARLLPQIFVNI